MGTLILLLCGVPPLAVMVFAAIQGFKAGSSTVLAMLLLSAAILSMPVVLPLVRSEEAVANIRFPTSNDSGVAAVHFDDDLVRLTRRWDMNTTEW